MPDLGTIDEAKNLEAMRKGELYYAFMSPQLIAARDRCSHACDRLNNAGDISRRRMVELWRDIIDDKTPLPPPASTPEEDDRLLRNEPWVAGPIKIDYGTNVRLGQGAFLNFNTVIVDTCLVTFGARTIVGPNCSFYSGTHPLDPALRNGLEGPESGKEIHIEEDCWIAGNVIVLCGVRIGRGATVGAGSVVTKDVPPFHLAFGNPARVIRKIETAMDKGQDVTTVPASRQSAGGPEAVIATTT